MHLRLEDISCPVVPLYKKRQDGIVDIRHHHIRRKVREALPAVLLIKDSLFASLLLLMLSLADEFQKKNVRELNEPIEATEALFTEKLVRPCEDPYQFFPCVLDLLRSLGNAGPALHKLEQSLFRDQCC